MLLRAGDGQDGPAERIVKEGDLVVVYERFDSMKSCRVTAKGQFSNKWGDFAVKDWIGKPYGSRVKARGANGGWAYILAPTPELWTSVLRHRTQILYLADISMVVMQLELRPGSIVLESGTGSGSLTSSLARAVAPRGHVHTFEFHELRADLAREDFAANGLSSLITVRQRDIEGQGFPDELAGAADAVFLDLPGPWKVVPSVAQCLRPDGIFCGFSPCIEQVQRTCEALARNGFHCLHSMEVLLRQHEVTAVSLRTPGAAPGAEPAAPPAKRARGPGTDEEVGADGTSSQAGLAAGVPHVLSRPVATGRGHTGYLTFARLAVQCPLHEGLAGNEPFGNAFQAAAEEGKASQTAAEEGQEETAAVVEKLDGSNEETCEVQKALAV